MTDNKEFTTLGSDGLAVSEGYLTVYNYSSLSGEYIGKDDVFLMEGVGIPAYSLTVSPPKTESGSVAVAKDGEWEIVPDYRGKTAYAKDNTGTITISEPGEPEEKYTLDEPGTAYDVWTDNGWATDAAKLKSAQVAEATAKRDALRAQADSSVVPLQDAVDLDEATEAETSMLKKWKQYRVALNRLDLSVAPDITWPKVPSN